MVSCFFIVLCHNPLMTMIDLLIDVILVTAISVVLLWCNSLLFRAVINRVALFDLGKNKKTFRQRLFITYVRELCHEDCEEMGLVKWFVAWFDISVAALVTAEVLIWIDTIILLVDGQRVYLDFYVLSFHVTWDSLDEFLGIFVFGAFPVSLLLALPVLLRIRAERKNKG